MWVQLSVLTFQRRVRRSLCDRTPPVFFTRSPESGTPDTRVGVTLGTVACPRVRSRAPPGGTRAWTQALRLRREVDPIGVFVPLRPLRHSLTKRNSAVRALPLPRLPYPIVPSPLGNAGTAELSSTVNKKSDRRSTAFTTAKLLLRGVRDSADAFGPLKSAVGGLCFILENYEVRLSTQTLSRNSYSYFSE